MRIAAILLGTFLIPATLWEMFEAVILPRTIARKVRLSHYVNGFAWSAAQKIRHLSPSRYQVLLTAFGPFSLLLLIATWAVLLVVGFGLLMWGLQIPIHTTHGTGSILSFVYLSGVTLFTLGYGDITPASPTGRALALLEAGTGIGFLAAVIGYLPTIYQSFSRRETGISLLDARAGSPPTGTELIRRYAAGGAMEQLPDTLAELERWAADLLESHLSYPVLAFYRSQHDRESWLAALAATLDACALIRGGFAGNPRWEQPLQWQGQLTYAMCRHALIDLCLVLHAEPLNPPDNRMPDEVLQKIRMHLLSVGIELETDTDASRRIREIRNAYEPFLFALAGRLDLEVPPFAVFDTAPDNWQTSAWGHADHF